MGAKVKTREPIVNSAMPATSVSVSSSASGGKYGCDFELNYILNDEQQLVRVKTELFRFVAKQNYLHLGIKQIQPTINIKFATMYSKPLYDRGTSSHVCPLFL